MILTTPNWLFKKRCEEKKPASSANDIASLKSPQSKKYTLKSSRPSAQRHPSQLARHLSPCIIPQIQREQAILDLQPLVSLMVKYKTSTLPFLSFYFLQNIKQNCYVDITTTPASPPSNPHTYIHTSYGVHLLLLIYMFQDNHLGLDNLPRVSSLEKMDLPFSAITVCLIKIQYHSMVFYSFWRQSIFDWPQ